MNYRFLTEVPTLSNIMLILLSLLLFIVAYKTSNNKRSQASKFFISLLGMTVLLTGLNNLTLINKVNAVEFIRVTSLPLTGHVDPLDSVTEYVNDLSNQTLVIDEILSDEDNGVYNCHGYIDNRNKPCSIGLELNANESCFISCPNTPPS